MQRADGRALFGSAPRFGGSSVTAPANGVYYLSGDGMPVPMPENDNLDALGNYLCQVVNQLCVQARLRCRLNVMDLPRDLQVSSQTRHNIAMAVKEAVHNTIKHAKAEEVTLRVSLTGRRLTVSVQDDGHGFDTANQPGGSGLKNMQRRLADLGGSCSIQSKVGGGTIVEMNLVMKLPE